ncbi:hypothetical protein GCM10027285_26440 [Oleiagrimonas citrea]|uniref:Filamentous hemagglutinin N-terminal domain-containing protein n=1 Tax=Oleiagrimonas citrea TaxID=1665687 RepID=A0A846ZLA7_9GAMM|nr:GLUG motif-containing protein [Oleiagrimonas citrea]NKZ38984.1 filamentous hemagglutinin N-terminal domain-containing protein [Oleiagrimonas citrea]
MNHIYRLVWNHTLGMLVAVSEIARGKHGGIVRRGERRVRIRPLRSALLAALGLAPALSLARPPLSQQLLPNLSSTSPSTTPATQPALAAPATPLPVGGQVVGGQAAITQNNDTLTVHQTSQNAIIDWQSFDIGSGYTVRFDQPGSSSVALNRVLGSDPSAIYGHLDANGQVFLVNPNGIYFAPGTSVDVGGIVASTLDIANQDFLSGNYHFTGASTAGVRNDGRLRAHDGGYVALLGANVSNHGSIVTPGGAAALGAGDRVSLTLTGNHLLNFEVSGAALNALAHNGGLIRADGGKVILSAKARDALLQTVVNNSGQIQAQTVTDHDGTIELLGGDSGTVQVGGTLDASAPNGGDGGFIETSGTHVKIAGDATVTSHAASGADGHWLIDPQDFTIAASGGDMTGAALSTALGGGNVTIQSTTGGTAGNGDIFVNDTVAWSANTLTLNAYRDIVVNTAMNGSGTAGLALEYGQGSASGVINSVASDYIVHAPINLANTGSFSIKMGTSGSTIGYTIITSLGTAGDASTTPSTMTLQGVTGGSMSANYVLGADIDASTTANWNPDGFGGYYGFDPIGDGSGGSTFTGRFDGLGHTISNLTTRAHLAFAASLFGYTSNSSIRNIGMVGGSVTGIRYAGGLVGYAIGGTIDNAYATGTVSTTSTNDSAGGLVGVNSGTISNAYATGNVNGTTNTGGLVGQNTGTISNAYATGNVVGDSEVGGLIGLNLGSSSKISNVYASGNVSGNGIRIGGLIGYSSNGSISNAYATGDVSGGSIVGGLLGYVYASTVSNVYATGKVSGSSDVGGLVGRKDALFGTITNGYWDTTTTGKGTNAGYGYLTGTATGGGGLTTAQLAAALPSGFASSNWDNAGNQTTPYLLANASLPSVSGHVTLGTDASATPTYYNVILNLTQLQNINSTGLGLNYVLGNTIDASATANWNGGAGFVPFGNNYFTNAFTGVFEGLGFTVSNLTINRPSASYVGLFGVVGSGGVVRNIGVTGGNVTGSYCVGALAGANLGTITDAYATSSVTGNSLVGGLVGLNTNGSISNVYATGNVTGSGNYEQDIGGLVGYNSNGAINNAYATGNVTGKWQIGGLVGLNSNSSTISDVYATGNVVGTHEVGGLVGSNTADSTITNAYATGSVSGTNHFGRLVGSNSNGAVITNGYWDTSTGLATGIGNNAATVTGGGGLTTAQLSAALPSGFNSSMWANAGNQTTPYLLSNASFDTYSGSVILGTDTSATPAQYKVITGLTQLQNMNSTGLGLDYVLGNNIDASGTSTWNSGAGFVPIGDSTTHFTGIFDGLGHSISSLTVNRPGTYYVGLFGYSSGTLRDVGLLNSSINGLGLVGALVGRSDGTVEYDYAIGGSVAVAQHGAGGLVGQSSGTIKDSYATDSVAGLNSGVASTAIGGLVGSMLIGSTTSNSYATGSVSGAGDVGALVGQNSGTVSTSYWDTDTSGATAGIGAAYSGATTSGTTGLTSTQMLQQASFTGFDFSSSPVWVIYEGHTMPLLNVFLTPLTVTAPDQHQTYTGGTFGLLNPTYSVTGADTSGHLFGLGDAYAGAVHVGSYNPDLWSDQQGYRITYVGGALTIDPKALTLSGLTVDNKVYDGTAAATIGSFGSLSGVVAGDSVNLVTSGGTANFADANAGTGKSVTISGLSLSGSSSADYTVTGIVTTADITARPLTVTLTGNPTKSYDGTTSARLNASNFLLSGFVSGQGATVNQTTGTYADAGPGSGIGVSATLASTDFLADSGTLLGNYILPTLAKGTGAILMSSVPGSASSISFASSASYGRVGIDSFALPLNPLLQNSIYAPGKPTTVHLTVQPSSETPSEARRCLNQSMDPFAKAASGSCMKH